MDSGIERLRASRDSYEEIQEAEGVRLGKEWATNTAEYDELKRIVRSAFSRSSGFSSGL
jgi:hypothetical protein